MDDNHNELNFQVKEAKKYFQNDKVVVFVCGDKPDSEVYHTADKVFYYSEKPLGPLKPWQLAINYAKQENFEQVIVVDGDDQHIFSEIKRVHKDYDRNLEKADVIIPERGKRIIYLSNSDIDRVTIEDLENAYIRVNYKNAVKDLQTGLFLLMNRQSICCLKLDNIDPWADDLVAVDQFYQHHLNVISPEIEVRSQRTTTFNQEIVFKRIIEFEKYFQKDFLNLIQIVEQNPEMYLFEGKISELNLIKKIFIEYKNRLKVNQMKGLILSGGLGTGLRPITHTRQKQLIPIANKPILFYAIEDLVNVGIKNIGIIIGPNKEQIIQTVGDGSIWGIKIEYIGQDFPRGLAHAVKIAQPYLQENDFIMYLGDNLIKDGIKEFADDFNNSTAEASIILTEVKDPRRFGVAKFDENKNIVALVEKPTEPPSNLAIVGIYAFRKSIFEAITKIQPSWRNELEITDALDWLIKNGKKIDYSCISGWWKDTGKPASLLEANQLVLDSMQFVNNGKIDPEAILAGRISIGEGTIIKKGANIRGPVVIGNNCEIGENTYIGPYTSIGNGVKLLSGEVEHSIILDNCFINSNRRIVDSLIGHNCSITSTRKRPSGSTLIIGDHSNIEL